MSHRHLALPRRGIPHPALRDLSWRGAVMRLRHPLPRHLAPTPRDRGDVPGWVMVTLMSALMVAGLYAIAGPALINLFNDAVGTIGGM